MAGETNVLEMKNLKSKKLWVGIVGMLVPVANSTFGWNLDVTEVLQILTPLFAYIVGQGLADFGKSKAGEGMKKNILKSKKFWAGLLGAAAPVVVIIVKKKYGVDDPMFEEMLNTIVYGIVGSVTAYIMGQGFADFGKHAKK